MSAILTSENHPWKSENQHVKINQNSSSCRSTGRLTDSHVHRKRFALMVKKFSKPVDMAYIYTYIYIIVIIIIIII